MNKKNSSGKPVLRDDKAATRGGRRRFLRAAGAGLGLTLLAPGAANPAPAIAAHRRRRVVIVGGGIAGTKVAVGLRRIAPDAEVVLIERNERYISGPSVLGYLFGTVRLDDITHGYERVAAAGVRMAHAETLGIDPAKQIVRTSAGEIAYDYLVVAAGAVLAEDEIEGLHDGDTGNLSILDRTRIPQLKRRIDAFERGTVLISVPGSALVCPPAPYEFALLFANRIKQRGLAANVLLLDAGVSPQPPPLSDALNAALAQRRDVIEYVWAAGEVVEVDAHARTVNCSHGDEFDYDFLSLVPGVTTSGFVRELGLGEDRDPFVAVDPVTMRSTRYPNLFALGDLARTPYGKSAYAAAAGAELCLEELGRELAGSDTPRRRKVAVACYPYVDLDAAMAMEVAYEVDVDAQGVHVRSSREVAGPGPQHALTRKGWERRLMSEVFGARS